jgi:alanine racemase
MIPQSEYRCWAEVDLDALRYNVQWARHRVGPDVKIMAVVKADAYGHGLPQIAGTLMHAGVDIFGVANLTEALGVRRVGAGWPILLLSASLPVEAPRIVAHDVMPTISSVEEAWMFQEEAARQKKKIPVHVKVDTGMGRLGFWHETASEPILTIARFPNLVMEGIYTHFSSADVDAEFSMEQLENFRKIVAKLAKRGVNFTYRHADNSAALLNFRENFADFGLNLVRPGLLLYGLSPNPDKQQELWPALSFKARVSFVKMVPAGRTLSYGRTFTAPHTMKVATLSVGYGDGFSRDLSNNALVLVGGIRCPVVGRVTMDQILADVSAVENVAVGDEVVLIGRQGDDEILASEMAAWANTIPWEILCAITKRVPRVYIGQTAA